MNSTRRRLWIGAEQQVGVAGSAQISKEELIERSSSKHPLKWYSRVEKLGRVPTCQRRLKIFNRC
jgi:hypothetical protein